MSHIRNVKVAGSTLMSRLYPNPQDHAAHLRKLGYVPPIWHRALRRAPPKDIYPLRRITKPTELPGDAVVRSVFRKIPMLRKEKYEFFNIEYQPLATRFALTQMRLQREQGLTEAAAFAKCEKEIFKNELYYFAKGIRDNKGNHFKLTSDELRSFYIHDLINEAVHIKKRVKNALIKPEIASGASAIAAAAGAAKSAIDAVTGVSIQAEAAENNIQLKPEDLNFAVDQSEQQIARDAIADYFAEPEATLEDILEQRGEGPVIADIAYTPYAKTGEFPHPHRTLISHHHFNPDDALLFRHGYVHHETQRYLLSQVQVPAAAFIDALEFATEQRPIPAYKMPTDWSTDDMFHPGALATPGGTHHYAKNAETYFGATEGLTYRQLNLEEEKLDKQIAAMLLEQDAQQESQKKAKK